MSRFARAYYGAAVGALLSLLLHPASRPYLIGPLTSWGPTQARAATQWIPDNLATLPAPRSERDLDTMALWMQAGAEAILRKRTLTKEDSAKLVQVATVAAEQEQNNAFWPQMKAALLEELGQHDAALREWRRASLRETWNDRQSSRLLHIRREIASETGTYQAWQLQTVYGLRSPATAQAIVRYAKHLLQSVGMESKADLQIRYATLLNAELMRDGSRYMEAGLMASDLMEAASYPQGMTIITNHRRLVLARQEFYHAMRDAGMGTEASNVHQAYRNNDAWVALTDEFHDGSEMRTWSLAALGAAVLPGIALGMAFFGAFLWLAGLAVRRSPALQKVLQPPLAPILGVLVAVGIYLLTELPLAAVTGVLCFAFLVFTPSHERTKPPQDLGPLFGFTMFLLGFALFLSLGAFLVGVSTPGAHTLASLDVPRDYYSGSTLFLGLSGILLGLMLLAAPTWAMIEHVATPVVVSMALKNLGSGLCAICLGLTVLTAPLAVYADRQIGDTLQKVVENEPNYYLLRT